MKNDTPNTIGDNRQPDGKFGKGNNANPNGRPVGSISIVEGIKRKLQEIEPGNQKTYLELFLSRLFQKAIKEGNEQLMRDMINRVDGMPMQKNELSGSLDLKGLINTNGIKHKSK